jgi:hypothetical protein
VQGNLGHVDEALVLAQRALALQVQLGTTDGPSGGVVETYVGLYCGMTGRYREALERLDSALARFRRDGQALWIAVAGNHKAQFLIELGQLARARQALDYDTPPVESVRARGINIAARIERALGASGEAELRRALEILAKGGDPHVRMHALLDEAAGLAPDAAVARCEEVMRMAGELEFVGVSMKASCCAPSRSIAAAAATKRRRCCARCCRGSTRRNRPTCTRPRPGGIAFEAFDGCGARADARPRSRTAFAGSARPARPTSPPSSTTAS